VVGGLLLCCQGHRQIDEVRVSVAQDNDRETRAAEEAYRDMRERATTVVEMLRWRGHRKAEEARRLVSGGGLPGGEEGEGGRNKECERERKKKTRFVWLG